MISCYFSRKIYRKHSEETKRKIALGNSKPFTLERRKAVSVGRTFVPTQEMLDQLKSHWGLRYLNPTVIMELCGLKNRKAIYERLKKIHCNVEQMRFMPIDWYPYHYELLLELGKQGIFYQEIAKILGFGKKQVYYVALKLGVKLNTRNPEAYKCIISKPEKLVIDWLNLNNFEIDSQFPLGNFVFDARIINSNVLVEVHGDYWHCNPRVYTNGPINEMQKGHMRRDFAKKAYAAKMGYYLITVWELDLKQKTDQTLNWLLGKVKKYAIN